MQRYYFDHNATTPIADSVLELFSKYLKDCSGNASSIHYHGQQAKMLLEQARRQVAGLLTASPKEIVFTSGGTEADNLAIFGTMRGNTRRHAVTTTIEHPAVLNAFAQLEQEGFAVTYVPCDSQGTVPVDSIAQALRTDTGLVSVMHANNELGTVQDIAAMADVAHQAGALFHSDGVQAAGKIPIDVTTSAVGLGVDLYAISGHKFHAPKGVGALYVRKGVTLQPLLFGGRHEQGRRAGTENVPALAAMGHAAEIAKKANKTSHLRDHLQRQLAASIPDIRFNAVDAPRIPNTLNVCFDGIEGESMVISLDLKGFSVSSGAACSSGAVEPSHVLLAIGLTRAQAKSSIRFSLGPANDMQQVDNLVEAVTASCAQLRRLSPTYA